MAHGQGSYSRKRRTPRRDVIVRSVIVSLLVVMGASAAVAAEQDALFRKMVDESRKVVAEFVGQVRRQMQKDFDLSGPVRSIMVCKYSSPEIAAAISRKTGWRISRVSLKPRNPAMGTPDAWEQVVLAEFDRRVQKGEKPENVEYAEIVTEPLGRYFRYMKALPVQPQCLSCHGPAESLSEAVKLRLAAEYPHDKAVGYRPGQVRGAVTIKRPL